MYRVVLDTNVFISAIVFGGKPREILELILEGKVALFVSEAILQEIAGVLCGRKFRYPAQLSHSTVKEIELISQLVSPSVKVRRIKKDPADNKFLECAVTSNADYIVSGDAHLLELSNYKGIRILTPAEFLRLYSSDQ